MLAFLNESRAVYESQSVAGTCEEGGSLPLAESGSLSSAAVVAEFPAPASDAGSVSDAEASPMSTCSVQTVVSSETEQALRQSLDSMRLYARILALLIGRARRRLLERPQAFEQVESLQGPLAAAVALHVRAVRILRASIFSKVGFRICGACMPSRIGKFVASSQICLRRSDRFRRPDPEMIVLIRNYSCQCFTEELVCGTGKALQKHPWLHPSVITVVTSVVPLQDKFYACLQTAWPWIL